MCATRKFDYHRLHTRQIRSLSLSLSLIDCTVVIVYCIPSASLASNYTPPPSRMMAIITTVGAVRRE